LRELFVRLWKPLAKSIPPATHKILLSADDATSFLPWAALLDENNRFLAERWELTQIGSSRDLLRKAERPRGNTLLAFADGKGDLPYSRIEVRAVDRIAELHQWHRTILSGEQASEGELIRHPSPAILHFATHAGQLPGDNANSIASRLRSNPMYRGYLLLGGGEATLERWNQGTGASFAVDGILTAEEASSLDLEGTWLTVLSACDTGAGDLRAGEGVLGLRRGFSLAGTRNLLFSLWPVQDDATAGFMKEFYERLFQSLDPAQSFHETQVAELLRWKQTAGITAAVHRAGGFVLTW
jgi:CHAT domain-containing protein